MTNEEIVLSRMDGNRFLGKRPIHFEPIDGRYFGGNDYQYNIYMDEFEAGLNKIKNAETVLDRVRNILSFNRATYHESGRFQCKSGANRSACDIWRIYKYYFGEIDIFSIMRALYKLANEEDLNTFRCCTVRKRVFWYGWHMKDFNAKAELGVPLTEWEHIGENND